MGDEEQEPAYDDDEQFKNDDEDLAAYLPSLTKQEVPEAERIIETLRETLSTRRLHKDAVCLDPPFFTNLMFILFYILLSNFLSFILHHKRVKLSINDLSM
jgi:hypothetical protein